MMDTGENYLSREEEKLLLRIARASLGAYVRDHCRVDVNTFHLTDTLREKHGAFVTLRNRGELRGCIGYTANEMPLAQTVAENAVNAAARDFRFPAVLADELDDITIEVSALTPGDTPETPFKRIAEISEIVIGRDGLYIERPPLRGGILLPQVPVEQGWGLPEFLSAICRKAGYADGAWKDPGTRLYRFSAQVFSEEDFPDLHAQPGA
jgi:AmmeMemoRadiSam system protein A